jgi:hypothetical protein
MRVCELAKKMQTSSLEVLKQADALGIEAYSPLTQLEAQDVSRLQDCFSKRTGADVERESAERAARHAEKMQLELSHRSAQDKADRAVLEANRARALEMDARAKGKELPAREAPAVAAASTARSALSWAERCDSSSCIFSAWRAARSALSRSTSAPVRLLKQS